MACAGSWAHSPAREAHALASHDIRIPSILTTGMSGVGRHSRKNVARRLELANVPNRGVALDVRKRAMG